MEQTAGAYPPLVTTLAVDRYEVRDVIATGGMGTVYRAFDKLGQRPVAYKRVRAVDEHARPRMAALFQREYDTLAQLSHPNIVEAHHFGFDVYGPFYTMELLSGDELTKLAPLAYRETCRLLRDVASALALLHARRLLHRDISPRNVCLSHDGRAKLIDFGALTPFGRPAELVGTPAFIAPECLTDTALDQRADLFSLGALAYWLLTRRPYVHALRIDDLPAAWQEPVTAPSHYTANLPKELDVFVLSLLEHKPSARPASAADVIEHLTTIAQLESERDPQRVAYSYLQRPPLIGRAPVLDRLRGALEQSCSGAGQLVLLEAEHGLGRSTLLAHLAVDAQMAGAVVLRAGAQHTAPFGAVHELVRAGLATFPAVAQRMRERSSQFVRIVNAKESREALIRSAIDASERQAALSSLLEESFVALSACAPLVLLVDDSHGLDGESLALFAAMAETLRNHPILIVLSTRSGQCAQDALVRAKLEHSALRLKLAPLGAEQLNELISTTFGGVPNCQLLGAWLFSQTGGNPAHSMELVRVLLAQGKVRYTLGTFTLPYELASGSAGDSRAEVLLASLDAVSPDAREVASLLALHAGALRLEELARARDKSAREVVSALDELAQRGAVLMRGESFCCASEALRAALLTVLTPEQRRALHLALARTLREPDAESLDALFASAEHLLHAGGAEQLEAAHLLARAAEQHKFELGMQREKLPLLESALAILERQGLSDKDCIGLLVPLSLAGFYGDLAAQRRYLDRTLAALSAICGLTLARRLARFLRPLPALLFALLIAFVAHTLRRTKITRRSFVGHLESLASVTGPATAAAACSFDVQEASRVVAWLEPLAAAPKRSPLYFMREFCVATSELIGARFASAGTRYASLVKVYEKPVRGIDARHAVHIRCGCLNGQAQALVTSSSPEALRLADELERAGGGAFFAPHAESVRTAFYAYRGEAARAALHRERAEALALRAGTCWSAMSILTVRSVLTCALSGDVVGLVRVTADLAQIAQLSTSLGALHALAEAHLDLLRGEHSRAIARYEQAFANPVSRRLPTYGVERALHAQALSAAGRHADARTLCLALLDELKEHEQGNATLYSYPRQRLALAEAELGLHAAAAERLDGCLQRYGAPYDNPLVLGALHRDRAYVALLAGERATFEHHLAAMAARFDTTENPWLMRQCSSLLAEARRRGLMEPEAAHAPQQNEELEAETAFERPINATTGKLERPPSR